MSGPGWPAVLTDGNVVLRPYRRRDGRTWSEIRRFNEEWLAKWEPTPPGPWYDLNSPTAYRFVLREMKRSAAEGSAMPFAVCVRTPGIGERLVGQLSLGSIVRRAFCSCYAGYWIDARAAGHGIIPTALALAVDHAFRIGGLHRVEVNIRPENTPSRRVVEKLGFREESHHERYLHIDGAWRDHIGYALTVEDVVGEGGLLARWHRVRGAAGRTPS